MSTPEPRHHRSSDLETLGVLSAFFLVLNLVTQRQQFVYLSLALLLVALFVRPLAKIISRAWMKFAEVIGSFNSRVILSLAYFLILTPLAVAYRMFNKNPLNLKASGSESSLFITRDRLYTRADFEKMW